MAGLTTMIIAIDVYYSDNKAKSVGVIFDSWNDAEPLKIISTYTDNPLKYEPGFFYKRELPCIQELLKLVDLNQIHTIIVDGYVYLDKNKSPGLGSYVYSSFSGRIPVIGVAKTAFHDNQAFVEKIYRGKSIKPLYITSIGIDLADAATLVQKMSGNYRIPHLLKLLDSKTREP